MSISSKRAGRSAGARNFAWPQHRADPSKPRRSVAHASTAAPWRIARRKPKTFAAALDMWIGLTSPV